VRKPGAFARYRFREALFPSLVFRQAYDALEAGLDDVAQRMMHDAVPKVRRKDLAQFGLLENKADRWAGLIRAAVQFLLQAQ